MSSKGPKDIVCPVEACQAVIGSRCKLVDLKNNPMMGNFHVKRHQAAKDAK